MCIRDSFDNVNRDQPGDDRDSAHTLALVRRHVRETRGRVRWCPHDRNPTDALTKAKGCHAVPLIDLCKTASYKLAPEQQELEKRAKHKELHGSTYRPKIGVRGAHREVQNRKDNLFSLNTINGYKVFLQNSLADILDNASNGNRIDLKRSSLEGNEIPGDDNRDVTVFPSAASTYSIGSVAMSDQALSYYS